MVSQNVISYLENKIEVLDERREDVRVFVKALERFVREKGVRKNFFKDKNSVSYGALEKVVNPSNSSCNFYGWGGEFRDDEEAAGDFAGKYGVFRGNSKALGKLAGEEATFYDNAMASGCWAGRSATFYDNAMASGCWAGGKATFYKSSE